MNLYFHIPFCLKRCSYCTFYAVATASSDVPNTLYVDALIEEMRQRCEVLSLTGRSVGTIFFGGGTPSMLDPQDIARLLSEAGKLFSISSDVEITLESNPETLINGRLAQLLSCGINRLSVGVQTFNDRFLKQLGRVHSAQTAIDVIRESLQYSNANVSIDLMWGFEGQTIEDLKRDLEQLAELSPDHVSLYQLTHDQKRANTLKYEIDDALSEEMWEVVCSRLSQMGFEHYEISNFARHHKRCRHNMGYWQYADYLGVGTSAVSFISNGTSQDCFGERITTMPRLDDYLQKKYTHQREIITREMAESEYSFLALRTVDGLSLSDYSGRFGREFEERFSGVIDPWVAEGWAVRHDDWISLTQDGWKVSNFLLSELV